MESFSHHKMEVLKYTENNVQEHHTHEISYGFQPSLRLKRKLSALLWAAQGLWFLEYTQDSRAYSTLNGIVLSPQNGSFEIHREKSCRSTTLTKSLMAFSTPLRFLFSTRKLYMVWQWAMCLEHNTQTFCRVISEIKIFSFNWTKQQEHSIFV